MKIELWLIGKNESYASEAIELFAKRIQRYLPFEVKYFQEVRKGNLPEQIKAAESRLILSKLEQKDYLIILDERGKEISSRKFAELIHSLMTGSSKKVIFLIGGAYGVEDTLRARANLLLSISKMTLSHQVARIAFSEQLYRALTIINREPYHHG